MNFGGIDLCCPACKADLQEAGTDGGLRCVGCGREYPVVLGIPDLRLFSDPYIDMAGDRAKGERIAAQWQRDFRGLVDFYYSISADVPKSQVRQFTHGLLSAQSRAQDALAAWNGAAGEGSRGAFLDLGCGSGAMVATAAPRFSRVVGIDIAFRWLVVARKRLEEAGVEAPLICACAEALPFASSSFDCVAAQGVIEHVQEQKKALGEAFRVLRPSGRIFLATPNRFSLGPDPHLGLMAGSLLPHRAMVSYAKRIGAVPPRRRLVSAFALNRLLRGTGFVERRLFLPDVTPAQRAQIPRGLSWLVDVYQVAKRVPVTRQLLYLIGPLLYAVAKKL